MSQDPPAPTSGLQRLWRLDAPPRGGRPTLSVRRVVAAAVELADAEGIGAVSMGRVAEQLGFTTMALYRHVAGKDELLELMSDAAVGEPPPTDGAAPWRARAHSWSLAMLRRVREHPWITEVPFSTPPLGPHRVRWMEAGLRALRGCALDAEQKLAVINTLNGIVWHEVSLEWQQARARDRAGRDPAGAFADYGRALASVAAPERFPELAALVADGVFGEPDAAPGPAGPAPVQDFDDPLVAFAVDRFLDGVELLLERQGGGAG
ncbi:TetR/AcrR family transcriptional regulator [Allonocardiopsis opalescens]|uniref:TetR family transcriptional regulator n=1 Tax=Allonocardiopsis opalescens TaxID=1144618 RepID=A0A2T0Q419_9ACTN|nr:TetR/AcrR family transcriptional regulator [Allonocardiopsis opalescens]PRX98548.1 TetR family transcriptional regulator [Allonocardiopsis opalescens]